jgi:hypothetical protein
VEASRERVDDNTSRSAAMSYALGTVLRQIGVTSHRSQAALEKTQTFAQRDKKTIKLSKAGKKVGNDTSHITDFVLPHLLIV